LEKIHLAGDSTPFFEQDFRSLSPPMANLNESKEETVGINLPPPPQPPVAKPPAPGAKSRETVRIQLGLRQPSDKLPPRIPAEPSPVSKPAAQVLTSPEVFRSPPAPPPPSTNPSPAVQAPVPVNTLSAGALSSGPKNETARIACMPDPLSKPLPTVQMKKTQALIAMPNAAPQRASIAVAPAEESAMPLCWVLLGVSAVILIIQIWTYLA
jgi:hypothetical protein